jgi:nucleoside 2-deoxyribosyltransferase
MTGHDEFNFPAFKATTATLRAAGFEVVCPSEISETLPSGSSWADYMRADLAALLGCDCVVILHDAICSRGARLECHVAFELGMPLYTLDELLGRTRRGSSGRKRPVRP